MEQNMSEKKYIIDDEKLMSEWNWVENNNLGLYPQILTFGSNKKASWKCSLNLQFWINLNVFAWLLIKHKIFEIFGKGIL